MILLNTGTDLNIKLATNSFPDKISSPTLPWLLINFLTFPWHLSHSQHFQVTLTTLQKKASLQSATSFPHQTGWS